MSSLAQSPPVDSNEEGAKDGSDGSCRGEPFNLNTAAPTIESLRVVGASAPSASSPTTRRAPGPSSRRPIQLLDFPDEILDQICRECREGDHVDSDFSFRDAKHLFPLSRTNRRLAALWRYVHYAFVDIDSPSLSLFFPNVLLNLVDLIITIPPILHNTGRIIPWRLTSILRQLPNLKALSLVPYQETAGPVAFEDESFSFDTSVPNLSILCMGYTLLGIEGSSKILDRLQVVGLDAGPYFSALSYGIEHVANLGLQLGEDLYGSDRSLEISAFTPQPLRQLENVVSKIQEDRSRESRLEELYVFFMPYDDCVLPLLRALSLVPFKVLSIDHNWNFNPTTCEGISFPGLDTLILDGENLDLLDVDFTSIRGLSSFMRVAPSISRVTLCNWFPALDSRELPLDVAACATRAALATAFPLVHEILTVLEKTDSILPADSRRITVSETEKFSFLRPLLSHIYSRRDIPRIEDFLLPVFKLLINDAVGNVLESFHPSLHPKTSAHFFRAWEGLTKTESPRGVARWRAMTYQGLQPTGDYPIKAKSSLVEAPSSFFSCLGVELSNEVFPEWTSSIDAVFRETIKFHDLVRHGYTSTELAVMNPTPKVDASVRFDGNVMEDESSTKNDMTGQKKGQQPDVLGVMAFGLRQRKWREKNGQSGVDDSVLLKAAVLTTKFVS